MLQSVDEDCLSTGKERGDRQIQSSNRFDSLKIDVNCPNTAVLLLGSRERPVLVAAAAALTKFAAKGQDNLQALFELNVVDNLLPLIRHDDLFTRRFAARLLAGLAAMPFVRDHLSQSDVHFSYLVETLITDKDTFIQEFSTLILAKMSKDPYGCAKILECRLNFDVLFELIKSPDPDVKKNTIELVDNLLKDPTAVQQIVASQNFSFALVFQLFEQPYPAIKKSALSVVESLVARSKDNEVAKLFGDSGGWRVLLDLLDNTDFFDLRSEILRILVCVVENAEISEPLNSDGVITKLFGYLESSGQPQDSRDVLEVVARLAGTESGRKSLHIFGVVKHLLGHLRKSSGNPELARIVCHGIGMMARYEPAAKEITEGNPVKCILDVLEDENVKWSTRGAAVFALKELSMRDDKNRRNLLEIGGHKYLQCLLKRETEKLPVEIGMAVVNILDLMGEYAETRKQLADADLIDAICSQFKANDRAYDELKLSCCKALSSYCVDKRAREFCLKANLVEKLFGLLQDIESTPVRAAALQLVQQLCADPSMAEQFVQAGYLS